MAINGICKVQQADVEAVQRTAGQSTTQFNPILQFAHHSSGINDNEPSEAKLKTEMFIDEIMSKLSIDNSKKNAQSNVNLMLHDLIETAQKLNGVQKNNLKPNGTSKQNEKFDSCVRQLMYLMNSYAESISRQASSLSIVQDSKTGQYKLCVNNKLYDIPERKVELGISDTDFGKEFIPKIVD